jgi:hypothetical protein
MKDIISQWIKFRRTCIEIMPLEKRRELFPETLENGYSWEAGGLADYIRVHMPPPNTACTPTAGESRQK